MNLVPSYMKLNKKENYYSKMKLYKKLFNNFKQIKLKTIYSFCLFKVVFLCEKNQCYIEKHSKKKL